MKEIITTGINAGKKSVLNIGLPIALGTAVLAGLGLLAAKILKK